MNQTNHHYILRFVLSITWFLPCVTKAADKSNVNITTSQATSNANWSPYPRSIQLRSGSIVGTNDEKIIAVIPTTIDLDILYMHPLFFRHLVSYPRIGVSFLAPYTLQKEHQLSFPNIWGILAYIELYQSYPILSTWGHRTSIGAIKGGILRQVKELPDYTFLAIEEMTYHWLCAPSLQVNFGMGLLAYWWPQKVQDKSKVNKAAPTDHNHIKTLNNIDNDTIGLKIAPIATIGIRYITHTRPFLRSDPHPVHYKKRKNSRVDCSIAGSSRRLPSTKRYHFIFRGASLCSVPINPHNALLCAIELGYNQYKKALLANMLPSGAIEVTTLLGYEIRYGRCLLQLQLGFEITDSQKLTIQMLNESRLSSTLKKHGRIAASLQYMLTEHFFVGISGRSSETPALRLGLSW